MSSNAVTFPEETTHATQDAIATPVRRSPVIEYAIIEPSGPGVVIARRTDGRDACRLRRPDHRDVRPHCDQRSDGGRNSETPAATEAPKADADLAYSFPVTMFQGQDEVGGDMVELGELLGKRPMVINFWAGLCPPCRAEMPDFQAFYEDFNDRVLLLGIDLGQFTGLGTQQDATDLLADLQVTYPAGFTDDGEVIKEYRVLGMPSTIFIDANGEVFHTWTGPLNEETLKEKTLEMLEQ